MKRRVFLKTMAMGGGLISCSVPLGRAFGHAAEQIGVPERVPVQAAERGPIIDVHMHAYPADAPISASLANPMRGGRPPGVEDGKAHMRACFEEMKRLNIVKAIVSGGSGDRLAAAMQWHEAAPEIVIAGAGVRGSKDSPLPPLSVLRKAFAEGRLKVFGEVTAQYAGLTLSDPQFKPYLALCEEFDIPVAVHMGMAPKLTSYDPCCRNFRVRFGNPMLIEEALNRHPKLRVNLMHAAWPYLQETIALMDVYPQVHADLGACGWILPRPEFYAYLGGLVRAGLSERVMFGSDHMFWPDLIGVSVEAVDSAPFLTPAEKRQIFHDNAARFYGLEPRSSSAG